MMTQKPKIKAGILGATGTVGQRFVQMLENHPYFEVTALAASDRSAGRPYVEAVRWKIGEGPPAYARDMLVQECRPGLDCEIVFSGLPSDVAGPTEEEFARAGYKVFSNASSHRMDPDVPLVIPEVNPDHLAMVEQQRRMRRWSGFIVTNPNCSTIHLVLALKPLQDAFGLRKVMVTTLQAVSGAGYPGESAMDLIDNVVPFIAKEEAKIESESRKLLGSLRDGRFVDADIVLSAACNRVATQDGHMECVSVELGRPASLEEVAAALREFRARPQELELPTAPCRPVVLRTEPDRPQPRLDRLAERGMATVVGRLRPCPILHYKFVALGHNTIRGAAGASILNAELMYAEGML
jgi:aspartate-semialdehyde dehydrogenase